MIVNTNPYVWSHGRRPRGYGFWWFRLMGSPVEVVQVHGRYSEAGREAVRQARARGCSCVVVMP
jgi:hypothetical protein